MRVLYLLDYFPYPPTDGLRLRPFNLLKWLPADYTLGIAHFAEPHIDRRGLATSGVRVDCYYQLQGNPKMRRLIHALGRYPLACYAKGLDELRAQLASILTDFKPDVVDCQSVLLAYLLSQLRPGVPLVNSLPDCNSLYHRLRFERSKDPRIKLIEFIQWKKFINFERDVYGCFDHHIVVGLGDKAELVKVCGQIPISVVPNGVDWGYFSGRNDVFDRATIAFVGVMSYPPNIDAVRYFVRKVLPLIRRHIPDVVFTVAGKNPARGVRALTRIPGVRVTGYVEDIRSIYEKAAIVVCPIRYGTGVKNKILEAMSMGKAIVATSQAVENISVADGENIVIADDPLDMAERIVCLLKDPQCIIRMGCRARSHVVSVYSWASAAKRLVAIYEELSFGKQSKQGVGASCP